ncbi:MAG: hypothetical protein CMJ28_02570 [Phycisphaerae bacterium]|nr:hypothetical protein [Phycisphaerae bacterium]
MGLVVWAQLEDEQNVEDVIRAVNMPLLAVGNPGPTAGALATRLDVPPLNDLRAIPDGSTTLLLLTEDEVTAESLNPWTSSSQQIFTTGQFPTEPAEASLLRDRVRLAPRFLRSDGFRAALDLLESSPAPRTMHADFSGNAATDSRPLLIDALDTLHHLGGVVSSLRAKQETPDSGRISVLLKHESGAISTIRSDANTPVFRRQLTVSSPEHLLEISAFGFLAYAHDGLDESGASRSCEPSLGAAAGSTIARFQHAGEEGRGPADLIWLGLLQAGIDLSLRTGDTVRPVDIAAMHGIRL